MRKLASIRVIDKVEPIPGAISNKWLIKKG